jgi:hypothetical protein
MPAISRSAKIDVHAPAEAILAVLAADVLATVDDPNSMVGHRPIDSGPLREGFRWFQTVAHDRKWCRTDWVVTELRPGQTLEQSMSHFCAHTQRALTGGERWELTAGEDGATLVNLSTWRDHEGLSGWLGKLQRAATGGGDTMDLKRRLAYVQFEAERNAGGGPAGAEPAAG